MTRFLKLMVCITFAAAFIIFPQEISAGVKQGAAVWLDVLLPSLFPFMTLCQFATLTGVLQPLAIPLRPLLRLLNLPDGMCTALLASVTGGYPAGAKSLATMVSSKMLSKDEAGTALCFSVNPGPAFVVVAVGRGMFSNMGLGWMLWASQLISTLIVAFMATRGRRISDIKPHYIPAAEALVASVSGCAAAMFSIGAYVILFSSIGSVLLSLAPKLAPYITGVLEVTSGCALAPSFGVYGAYIAAFMIGFSGISVICQVMSIAKEARIPCGGLVRWRIVSGLISPAVLYLLLRLFPQVVQTSTGYVGASYSSNHIITALCLIGMLYITFDHRVWKKFQMQ